MYKPNPFAKNDRPKDYKVFIDADSLIYQVSWLIQKEVKANRGRPDLMERSIRATVKRITSRLKVTDEQLRLHFTSGKYNKTHFIEKYGKEPGNQFRKNVTKTYKDNRKGSPAIYQYHMILAYMLEHWHSVIHDRFEADDAIVLLAKEVPIPERAICAIDKDVINQIEGKCYNYMKNKWTVPIGPNYVRYYKYYQAIVGDSSDGYIGVKGIGKASVGKFISVGMSEYELWEGTLKAYKSKSPKTALKDAIATLRLSSMHQLQRDEEGRPQLKLYVPPISKTFTPNI